nr:hypothetical protein [Methanohalophilus profundi]
MNGCSNLKENTQQHVTQLSKQIAAGFIISVFVGLVAGVYPAKKAAKMNPTDALRNE